MTRQLVVDPASSHLSSGQIACAHPPLTPKMTDARRLWPNGLASQRKPELAYGLAMGGQADSQVGSQVHASHKNLQLSSIYSWLAINLCRLALGGQTVKNLRWLAYEFELDQSQRKWVAKRNASRKLSLTCVDLWVRLARALHYINSSYRAAIIFNEWIWRSAFWWVISGTLPCIWNYLIFLSCWITYLKVRKRQKADWLFAFRRLQTRR